MTPVSGTIITYNEEDHIEAHNALLYLIPGSGWGR